MVEFFPGRVRMPEQIAMDELETAHEGFFGKRSGGLIE